MKPATMEIKRKAIRHPTVKGVAPNRKVGKYLQERTERELAKLRSPTVSKNRVGQQTLGEIIEI
jgi:hypothetical protein